MSMRETGKTGWNGEPTRQDREPSLIQDGCQEIERGWTNPGLNHSQKGSCAIPQQRRE